MDKLICGDVQDEKERSYQIFDAGGNIIHTTTIEKPKKVFFGKGHAFHRVFDGVSVILCETPGPIFKDDKIVGYCELSWEPENKDDPCQW
jgi:hypothetical protein